jgi:hypothetical protein
LAAAEGFQSDGVSSNAISIEGIEVAGGAYGFASTVI